MDPLAPRAQGVQPFPDEPAVEQWQRLSWAEVRRRLRRGRVTGARAPFIVAVDGRSGGGKSTAADHLARGWQRCTVIHTDDVAWWESYFGWDRLLVDGILTPVREGTDVRFRPPAWQARGREGCIAVPRGLEVLIVEGVGSARRSLMPWIDAVVWVQSDEPRARARGIDRDGGDVAAREFWESWQAEEVPFLAAERPWERADVILCGTPECLALESQGTSALPWAADGPLPPRP